MNTIYRKNNNYKNQKIITINDVLLAFIPKTRNLIIHNLKIILPED